MMEELAKLLTVQNGLLVTILGGAFAYFTRILNRLEANLRQDMASMEARVNNRFDQVDARFERMEVRTNDRFDRLEASQNILREDVQKIGQRVAWIEGLLARKLDVEPTSYPPLGSAGTLSQQEAQAGVGEPSPDDSKNPPTPKGKGEVQ